MKTNTILILFLILTGNIYAQDRTERAYRELESLEKLTKAVENGKIQEFEAKKSILNFFYDTKAEVRKQSSDLSEYEREKMNDAQSMLWKSTIIPSVDFYAKTPNGYSRFLRNQYELLLKYNDSIMELLYYALDYDLSEKKHEDMFDNRKTEFYFAIQAAKSDF